MNSDIRISTTFFQHHKTKKLLRKMGGDGVVYLLKLWTYTAQYRPSGDLEGMSAEDIAVAVDWPEEPEALVQVLAEIGFLDTGEGPSYVIHDWEAHNPFAAGAGKRSERAKAAAKARWGNPESGASNASGNAKGMQAACDEHAGGMRKACAEHAPSINKQCPSPSPSPSPAPLAEENRVSIETRSSPEGPATPAPDPAEDEPLKIQTPKGGTPPCPHQDIIALYHKHLPELPQVKTWSGQRQKWLRSRWAEDERRQNLNWWELFFLELVREQPFLLGREGNGKWLASLEWLVRPTNFAKVLEGHYKRKGPGPGGGDDEAAMLAWAEEQEPC